jgi:hypothetical protein
VTRHIDTTAGELRHGDLLRLGRSGDTYVLVDSTTITGDEVNVTLYDGPNPARKPTLRYRTSDPVQLSAQAHREPVPPAVAMPLGTRSGVSPYDTETPVIGVIDQASAGNSILRVGRMNPDRSSWHQELHIVLTPDEREALIAALISHRPAEQMERPTRP